PVAAPPQPQRQLAPAHAPALARLRHPAARAPRPCRRVEPANRRVAAALANRWAAALRARKDAEDASVQPPHTPVGPFALTAERSAALTPMGHKRPQRWPTPRVSHQPTHAVLRGLLAQGVRQRAARALVQTRILWQGSDT